MPGLTQHERSFYGVHKIYGAGHYPMLPHSVTIEVCEEAQDYNPEQRGKSLIPTFAKFKPFIGTITCTPETCETFARAFDNSDPLAAETFRKLGKLLSISRERDRARQLKFFVIPFIIVNLVQIAAVIAFAVTVFLS